MGLHRGVLQSLEYATDYDPDNTASGTWVTVPRGQLLSEGSTRPGEQATTVDGTNLIPLAAIWINNGVQPVAMLSTDTWQNGLKSASDNLTLVWFRIRELGQDFYTIIGGVFGCGVVWNERAIPDAGGLEKASFAYTSSGNLTGQTLQTEAVGSGS
jgi:hypothetical protein